MYNPCELHTVNFLDLHAVNSNAFYTRFLKMLGKRKKSEYRMYNVVNDIVSHVTATQELSARTESLLREGERAYELGLELSRETDEIRRDLEGVVRTCSGPDRSLCAVIDSSGIRLDLRIERVNKLYD